MIVNGATLAALMTALNKSLQEGFDMADVSWERWCMSLTSTRAREDYGMALLLSSMREWIGPRQIQSLKQELLQVTNKDYEHSLGIPTNNIEDDNLAMVPPAFRAMGMDAKQLWPYLATMALVSNGNWLDGSAFFYASRSLNGNTIANYVTDALSETTFNTAYTAMTSYVNHAGKPMAIVPKYLMVGPKNRTVAHGIVNQGPGATAANPNAGAAEVIVNPYLVSTYDDYWFLLAEKAGIKAVAVQKRKEGALVALDKPTDTTVFLGNVGPDGTVPGGVNVYGIHYRGAAFPTLPILAYGGFAA